MTKPKRITDRKVKTVIVPTNNTYGLSVVGSDRFELSNPAFAGDYTTEDWGWTWQKSVRVPVYLDGSDLDEVNDTLRKAAEGLVGAYLDVDGQIDGGADLYVRGRRPATEEEKAEVLRFYAWSIQLAKELELRNLCRWPLCADTTCRFESQCEKKP